LLDEFTLLLNGLSQAVEALGKLASAESVPELLALARRPGVNLTAIWALGSIGDKQAVPLLTDLLESDDEYVRYNAFRALKMIAGEG